METFVDRCLRDRRECMYHRSHKSIVFYFERFHLLEDIENRSDSQDKDRSIELDRKISMNKYSCMVHDNLVRTIHDCTNIDVKTTMTTKWRGS